VVSAVSRRLILAGLLAIGIPVFLSAEYWALGRLSVFRLDNANPFFLPQLHEVAVTRTVPTWSPLMSGGILTRPQSQRTPSPLPQLALLVGPIAAYQLLYLLALGAASVTTFLLMRDTVGAGALFGVAAAYIYANTSFEQLVGVPEYVGFMLTPLILWIFASPLARTERVTVKALLVVALSVALAFVGDFARCTIWMLVAFTPVVLLLVRPFRWSIAGWWAIVVVLTVALSAREIYAIAAFNPWSERGYFTTAHYDSILGPFVAWTQRVYWLAREQRGLVLATVLFLAATTYLGEHGLRRRIARQILAAIGVLMVIDVTVWVSVWTLRNFGGSVGVVARSLTMRMETVLWAYAPLAVLMILGSLPRDLCITAGTRRLVSVSTVAVLVMLGSSGWNHASRIKGNVMAWLDNRTLGFFLGAEPLRRLQVDDSGLFRVSSVQSRPFRATDVNPGHLLYYGFETADSAFSNQIHVFIQFWDLVEPGVKHGMDAYLTAPVVDGRIDLDEHFRLPLLSLMNTKYLVSRVPLASRTGRIVAVHIPREPDAGGGVGILDRVADAARRNRAGGDFYVYQNLDAFDRALVVSKVRAFPDERALLEGLGAARTEELRESAFMLRRDAERIGPLEHDPHARATIDRYAGSSLDVSVTSRGPAIVVVSNTVGPWWRCWIGAHPLETFAVYHAWLGVRVNGGAHHVTCAVDLSRFELFGGAPGGGAARR
jgi:hypothetical protein